MINALFNKPVVSNTYSEQPVCATGLKEVQRNKKYQCI